MLVVRVGDRLVLIDGYVRVSALSQLGRDMVDGVVLEDLDEVGALLMRHRQQASRSTALEDGWLLVELLDVTAVLRTISPRRSRSRPAGCRGDSRWCARCRRTLKKP